MRLCQSLNKKPARYPSVCLSDLLTCLPNAFLCDHRTSLVGFAYVEEIREEEDVTLQDSAASALPQLYRNLGSALSALSQPNPARPSCNTEG